MAPTEYKLKVSAVDVQAPGAKVESEVEGVPDAKVLLLNVKGTVKAISHKCTHYGAPLVKGVLTPDGRLTCPWHGACFNVHTGDIEDAPALDPLVAFPCAARDGELYITAEEGALKAGRRKPLSVLKSPAAAEHRKGVLIVGGGAGGLGVIEGLREGGYAGAITVLSKEAYAPIDRTRLSKALATDAEKLALRPLQTLIDTMDVNFLTGSVVVELDTKNKVAKLENGDTHAYKHVVLATGGTPRELPLPGFKELGNIFVLRGVTNAKAIVDATSSGKKRVVVVGSSFIGLEVANALAKNHDVTVIGMESAPLERVLGVEVGNKVKKLLEKNGIKFKLDAHVASAVPSDADKSAVGGIKLKTDETIPADVVILGVGVKPTTDFLASSGLKLENDGGLAVDENFAVKNADSVYAVGDIAKYPYLFTPGGTPAPVRIEHWNVALNAGRAVGRALAGAGKGNVPAEFIPVFWSAVGQQVRYCGHPATGFDEVIVRGDADDKFSAFYAKGQDIVAVATVGTDPVMVKSAELLRARKFPTANQIKQGVDVLALAL